MCESRHTSSEERIKRQRLKLCVTMRVGEREREEEVVLDTGAECDVMEEEKVREIGGEIEYEESVGRLGRYTMYTG